MKAVCPTTGEPCFYRAQLDKIADAADFEATFNGSDDSVSSEVARVFRDVTQVAEQAPCDEDTNYCVVLGRALSAGLLAVALQEYNHKQGEQ